MQSIPTIPNPALVSTLADALLREETEARQARASGKPRGPITGFRNLDEALGGFLWPGLHVILAAPGAGKTALALQIASQCQTPALYVSAEMRSVDLLRRLAGRVCSQYFGKFRDGHLSEQELKLALEKTAKLIPHLAIYDANLEPAPPGDIQEQAALLRETQASPHILIVLDSLTDWAASLSGKATEYEANEFALSSMKRIAAHLVCPIVMIVHRNRSSNNSREDANQLHSGKGTGRIEYIAESVWNLSMDPPVVGAKTRGVRLTFAKNRFGKRDEEIRFDFNGELQQFTEG